MALDKPFSSSCASVPPHSGPLEPSRASVAHDELDSFEQSLLDDPEIQQQLWKQEFLKGKRCILCYQFADVIIPHQTPELFLCNKCAGKILERTIHSGGELPHPLIWELQELEIPGFSPEDLKGKRLTKNNWSPDIRIFKALIKRDGLKCQDCASLNIEDLTVDHIIPRSRGGSNKFENLRLICKRCNCVKGNRIK